MSKGQRVAVIGSSVTSGFGLVGLLIGAAVQINHPHHQAGWDAQFWLSGLLIGLAAGVLAGGFAALVAWDTTD